MIQHAGTRFLIVALLVLLMALPLFMVAAVIGDRLSTARDAAYGVEREWAGEQLISGPRIVVPVRATVTTTETVSDAGNAAGATITGGADRPATAERRVTRVVDAAPLILLPESFDLTAQADSEIRRRGVFDVPVYTAAVDFQTRFIIPDLAGTIAPNETVQWDDARIQLDITWNKGLRGETTITRNGEPLVLEPMRSDRGGEGIEARLGDPRGPDGLAVEGTLSLRGSAVLRVAPVGRISRISMTGDWPDPGFAGVLPDGSEVTETGFRAEWAIPNLARTLPQTSRGGLDPYQMQEVSGDYPAVRFLKQNDFYQQAFRATRYAILMIALTFLTVFLVENRDNRPAHPVQYILIGLAQSLFVLLMVAYAEHFGFGAAFLGSSAATIALLTLFGATALRMGRRTWVMSALLIALYAVLWLILRSVDYALLAGATLAFVALAATMIMTRNENWYGPARPAAPAPAPESRT